MTSITSLHAFWSLLCAIIALFYLFRLVGYRAQVHHFDAENEVGHGMMAVGMTFMLAPVGLLTSDIILWNSVLFAVASLWFTGRLLVRKPLLAMLLGKKGEHSTFQSDVIHVFTHAGMCYMFLLMSSMTFSMSQPVMAINYIVCFAFAFLTLFSVREISKDFQTATMDRVKLGADLAHVFMNGIMSWMFIEMISMTMRMISP